MESLHPQRGEEGRARSFERLLTPDEALFFGLIKKRPKPVVCAFCGKSLTPLGAVVSGKVVWVSHVPCTCKGQREKERRESEARAEEEDSLRKERLSRIGIPRLYQGAMPADEACKAYASCFSSDTSTGLYLQGGVGTGKTYNAAAIAANVSSKGFSVLFTSAIEIFSAIRETFATNDSSSQVLERYAQCKLLVLDDLGKEPNSRWSVMTLFTLINARYEQMYPTIFTSQYDLKALRNRLASAGEHETADAIISCISATCAYVVDLCQDFGHEK